MPRITGWQDNPPGSGYALERGAFVIIPLYPFNMIRLTRRQAVEMVPPSRSYSGTDRNGCTVLSRGAEILWAAFLLLAAVRDAYYYAYVYAMITSLMVIMMIL